MMSMMNEQSTTSAINPFEGYEGCLHRGWRSSKRWLFHVPEDMPLLAETFHAPLETVLARLASGELLTRKYDLPGLEGEFIFIKDVFFAGLMDYVPPCGGRK